MLKNWKLCAIDAEGMLGGLVTWWNKNVNVISSYVISTSINIKGAKDLGKSFKIINIYGPYQDQKSF